MTYAERIALSKEQKDTAGNAARVKQTSLELDMTILNQEKVVNAAKSKIDSALNEFPVRWDAVIEARQNSAVAEANLEELNAIKAELFPATA